MSVEPGISHILAAPLDGLDAVDQAIVRMVAQFGGRLIGEVRGVPIVLPDRDPFVLVANHTTRREAVLLPMLLLLLRGGRHVRRARSSPADSPS